VSIVCEGNSVVFGRAWIDKNISLDCLTPVLFVYPPFNPLFYATVSQFDSDFNLSYQEYFALGNGYC